MSKTFFTDQIEIKGKKNGTKTSSFGTPGRINHDSSSFYNSKLYQGLDNGGRVKYVENKIKSEIDQNESPETIDIEKPGEYSIDLKGLLEKEPIIIQKDGSYTIHLPSVFKMIEKE